NVIAQTLTSIGTYPTNPYYAEVALYRYVQNAAAYLRGCIRGSLHRAHEADALGEYRCAEHEWRQAERYPEMLRQLAGRLPVLLPQTGEPTPRSEEHTSELQSRENLVCRLLPETIHSPYLKSAH